MPMFQGGRYLPYGISGQDPWQETLGRYTQGAQQARQISDVIQGSAPHQFGQFIEPSLRSALAFQMQHGGMPQEQFDVARRGLGTALQGALSQIAGRSAARGFYDPNQMGAQSAGAMKAFGSGLAQLYGQKAELRQKAMADALKTTAGLAPIAAEQSKAGQLGYGALVSQFAQPRSGISMYNMSGRRMW